MNLEPARDIRKYILIFIVTSISFIAIKAMDFPFAPTLPAIRPVAPVPQAPNLEGIELDIYTNPPMSIRASDHEFPDEIDTTIPRDEDWIEVVDMYVYVGASNTVILQSGIHAQPIHYDDFLETMINLNINAQDFMDNGRAVVPGSDVELTAHALNHFSRINLASGLMQSLNGKITGFNERHQTYNVVIDSSGIMDLDDLQEVSGKHPGVLVAITECVNKCAAMYTIKTVFPMRSRRDYVQIYRQLVPAQ